MVLFLAFLSCSFGGRQWSQWRGGGRYLPADKSSSTLPSGRITAQPHRGHKSSHSCQPAQIKRGSGSPKWHGLQQSSGEIMDQKTLVSVCSGWSVETQGDLFLKKSLFQAIKLNLYLCKLQTNSKMHLCMQLNTRGSKTPITVLTNYDYRSLIWHSSMHNSMLWPLNTFTIVHDL